MQALLAVALIHHAVRSGQAQSNARGLCLLL